MVKDKLGWILIHAPSQYEEGDFKSPIVQLRDNHDEGRKWHWNRGKPLNTADKRSYRLLLAWNGKIFGECVAGITHEVNPKWREYYNFAFVLNGYREIGRAHV